MLSQLPSVQQQFSEFLLERSGTEAAGSFPKNRWQVYRNSFWTRIEESMTADFPRLKNQLSEAAWLSIVKNFVREQGSRHHSLYELSSLFPQYLEKNMVRYDLPGFVADLACFEWKKIESFIGREFSIGSSQNPEVATLRISSSFRLLYLKHQVASDVDLGMPFESEQAWGLWYAEKFYFKPLASYELQLLNLLKNPVSFSVFVDEVSCSDLDLETVQKGVLDLRSNGLIVWI